MRKTVTVSVMRHWTLHFNRTDMEYLIQTSLRALSGVRTAKKCLKYEFMLQIKTYWNRNETLYSLSRHLANRTVKDVNLPGINDQEAMLSVLYFANFQIAFWAKTHLRYLSSHGHNSRTLIINFLILAIFPKIFHVKISGTDKIIFLSG